MAPLRIAPQSRCNVYVKKLHFPVPNASLFVGECHSRRLRLIWDFLLPAHGVADSSMSISCWGKSTESSPLTSGIQYVSLCAMRCGGGCFETKQQAGFYA